MITARVTGHKAVRIAGGVICALFVLAGLGRAGEAFFELIRYGAGHPVQPVLELPLSFFDAAQSRTTNVAGGSSPIAVTVFSGPHAGRYIAVISRHPLDRGQEYHPAIRAEKFDAQISALVGRPAPVFDAVVSVPGYYFVKLLSGLALAAVTGVILLLCLGRQDVLLDFFREHLQNPKEEEPR